MSRRLPLAMVVIALVAGSCGESDVAATSTTTTETPASSTAVPVTTTTRSTTTTEAPSALGPRHGGTVVIADDQHPATLNPFARGGDYFIVTVIGQALHTGAYDIDAETLERIPEVAVELPTVANGGVTINEDGTMTIRYQIRDEAMWADGTPISGDDFAFTLEVLSHPELGRDTIDEVIEGSVEPGPKTFSFALRTPTLGHETLFQWLIPAHQVRGSDVLSDWNDHPWFSGGPFLLDTWEKDERITLVRNPNYWKTDEETGEQLPYLDEVVFEFIPETDQIVAAFAAREVDVIQPPPFGPMIDRLRGLEGAEVTVTNGPVWEHLNFQFGPNNRNPDSLNRHVEFRRAIAHAIDRVALTEAAQEGYGSGPLSSYLDTFTPGLSTGAWDRYPYDPATASELLAGLCADVSRDCETDPPAVVFSTTSNSDMRPRVANSLVEQLAQVGIEVELQLEDSQLYFGETLDNGTWDLGWWAWVGSPGLDGVVAIHDVFDPDAPGPAGTNYYRWGDVADEHTSRFAEIVDQMEMTVDEGELIGLIQEAEQILADQVVIIPAFARLVVSAVWADEIAGFQMNPTQAGHTWNIEHWYRVDV